ncbi:MAG: hypothetical protein JXA07_01265 [Spirochaetes bacterium]|nr:hypothetical protein [Spirochaetota bacterium]
MKRLILLLALCLAPFVILADAMDDPPSTGKPFWHYFEYEVSCPEGEPEVGRMKVCASNAMVAVTTGRAILIEKYGKCGVRLAIKERGAPCDEERTGEVE